MSVGPQIEMHVKEERVGERYAYDGNTVSDAKKGRPSIEPEVEKSVKSYNKVAGVPPAHCDGQKSENALVWRQLGLVSDK